MNSDPELLATYLIIIINVISLAIILHIGLYKTLVKAGSPGWAIFVPIYNFVCLFRMASLPLWMILGLFVPLLHLVLHGWLSHNISKNFGKGIGMTILLFFGIGYVILGFGDETFQPRNAQK